MKLSFSRTLSAYKDYTEVDFEIASKLFQYNISQKENISGLMGMNWYLLLLLGCGGPKTKKG